MQLRGSLHIEDGGALVAPCDRVVGVIGKLGSTDNVTPLDANLVSSLYIDDFGRNGSTEAKVAGHVVVVDILDGVILAESGYLTFISNTTALTELGVRIPTSCPLSWPFTLTRCATQ